MIEQAVEFSTRGGNIEYVNNISRGTGYTLSPGQRFKGWTWSYGKTKSDIASTNFQRGVIFKYEPTYQMPFGSLTINSISIPRWGMMSHIGGRLRIGIVVANPATNLPVPDDKFGPNPSSVIYEADLVGFDCDSAYEVIQKMLDDMMAYFAPNCRSLIVTASPTRTGQILFKTGNYTTMRMDNKACVNWGFDIQRTTDFLGNYDGTAYDNPPASYFYTGICRFPFGNNIRLNCNAVVSQAPERNVSRNMEIRTNTQHVATFPLSAGKQHSLGPGHGTRGYFTCKNPNMNPTVIKQTRAYCCVQSLEFWFTYGDNDDNLYEAWNQTADDITRFNTIDVAYPTNPPANVTRSVRNGIRTLTNTMPYSDSKAYFEILTQLEPTIFATLNQCDCLEDRASKYIIDNQ